MQSQNQSTLLAGCGLPLVGIEQFEILLTPRNPKIRPPPVDDVNNLRHHCRCQRCFAPTAIQIRRNALFTSSEYAAGLSNKFSVLKGAKKMLAANRPGLYLPS